jgi:hypothetical protein
VERYLTDVCGARTLAWSIAPAQREQTFFVVARLHAVRRDDDVVEILARARRRPAPGRLFLPEAPF